MRFALSILLCVLVVAASGCPRSYRDESMNVVVDGGGRFPASLAGRWRADRDGWEFVLGPDGRIVSAVLSLGRVRVTPGQKVTIPTRSGGEGVFEPGEWTVYYEPETSDLTIKIAMDHVRVEMGEAILEGSTIDVLSGAISAVYGTWQVQWSAFSQYTVQGTDQPVTELSTHPERGETKVLTFQRVPEE